MANVAGVSQLLETVGTPANQPGLSVSPAPSAPSFATVMQQANTDAGVPATPAEYIAPATDPQTLKTEPTMQSSTPPAKGTGEAQLGAVPSPASQPLPSVVPKLEPSTQPRYSAGNMLRPVSDQSGSTVSTIAPPPHHAAMSLAPATTAETSALPAEVSVLSGSAPAQVATASEATRLIAAPGPPSILAAEGKLSAKAAASHAAPTPQKNGVAQTPRQPSVTPGPFSQTAAPVLPEATAPLVSAAASIVPAVNAPLALAPTALSAVGTADQPASASTQILATPAMTLSTPQGPALSSRENTPPSAVSFQPASIQATSLQAAQAPPASAIEAAATASLTAVTAPPAKLTLAHAVFSPSLTTPAAGDIQPPVTPSDPIAAPAAASAMAPAAVAPLNSQAAPPLAIASTQKTSGKATLSAANPTLATASAAGTTLTPQAGPVPPVAPVESKGDTAHSAPAAPQPAALAAETASFITPLPAAHTPIALTTLNNPTGPTLGTTIASTTGMAGTTDTLPHTTLSSSPTSLEVGVVSGTHGWLKIRAELNASGTIDASLTGTSTATTGKLHNDLPALSSFLQDEKVALGSLNVAAPNAIVSALHAVAATPLEPASSFTRSAAEGIGATGTAVASDAGAFGGRAPHQQAPESSSALPITREEDGAPIAMVAPALTTLYGVGAELTAGGSLLPNEQGGGSWLNVRV